MLRGIIKQVFVIALNPLSLFLLLLKVSEDGYQNDVDFRQGKRYLTESDPTTFRIQAKADHQANHKKRAVNWTFFASQPSQGTDWGAEASFNSHGKSFDSAISVRYAPGKKILPFFKEKKRKFLFFYFLPFCPAGTSKQFYS